MKLWRIIVTVLISAVLAATFGVVYFSDHAWGTWGDDSAGYIYLAGRMYSGEPLVYHDELVKKGYDFFQDEKLSRWLTPTHHFLINQQGTIASKYPVGMSLLMFGAARLMNTAEGFYIVTPLLAAANIVLLYWLSLLLFSTHRYKHAIGVLAACMLGITSLYYDYAIAQPMREIPSITFLLLTAIFLYYAVHRYPSKWETALYLLISGAAFGFAVTIRETSLLVLPGFCVYAVWSLWNTADFKKRRIKQLAIYSSIYIVAMLIGLIPTIQNAVAQSAEKEVFKERDTSEIVLLPNAGHINTISAQNLFDNEGKFRPGKGALPQYWAVMQAAVPVPYFLLFVVLGFWYLWKESKPITALLSLWILGTLTIFSLWINPYARYILPLFPPLLMVGSYGLFMALQDGLPRIIHRKLFARLLAAAVLVTVGFAYQPVIAQTITNVHTDVYRFKAISRDDLHLLEQISQTVGADRGSTKSQGKVLMFSGTWQYGTSETLQAHTGLKTIRSPFEQNKYDFKPKDITTFLDRQVVPNTDLYVWVDITTDVKTLQWLDTHDTELVGQYDFTFQPDVSIYRVQQ